MDVRHGSIIQNRCLTCKKLFNNVTHLRRHENSHTKDRTYQCTFCSRNFLRHDALRRHLTTCSRKEHDVAVPVAKRGRKSSACQNCQSKKLGCDRGHPCKRCSSKQIKCSYSLVDESELSSSRVLITFLRNYTDPLLESISDAFVLSEAHPEPPTEVLENNYRSNTYLQDDYMAELFSGVFSDLDIDHSMETYAPMPASIAVPSSLLTRHRIEALIVLLEVQFKSTPSAFAKPIDQFPESLARMVFTSNNIVKYVTAFFSYFHPHVLLIHQPSFDIEKVFLPLLLAISLLGSVFCIPQDDALAARHFFDLAEEYVFGILHVASTRNDYPINESIHILQAAFLIHALQMDSNRDDVRLRIRVHRFPSIIALMRRLQMFGTIRSPYAGSANWEQFIIDEVKIRLATRIIITDCMLTLLFKSPPQITVAEMCGDLPSADAAFEASTSAEFAELAPESAYSRFQTRSLKGSITFLLQEDWPGPETSSMASIGAEHLMGIIFVIHSLIFVSRTGLLMPSTYQVLHRATDRWKELWQREQSQDRPEKRRPIGFVKYCLELWWLAQKILQLAQDEDLRSPYMSSNPTNSLKELHSFIQEYAER